MNLEQMRILSFYEELTDLDKKKNVVLVKHIETGELFVKKIKEIYSLDVYEKLKENEILNIPQIKECFEADDRLYVIEEFIHGKDLGTLFKEKGNLPEEDVLEIGIQVSKILCDLSGMNPPLIHRDIKPSNLLLTNDNHIKLIDFNAAKQFSDRNYQDTVLMGTKNFAAPEQYGFGASDARTDIYGIGVTMNYLLTGNSIQEGITQGKLGKVIRKCTNMNPNDRYQKPEDLYKVLCQMKEKNTKKQEVIERKERNKYLIPGFRSGRIWKMIVAICGYAFIGWLCFTMEFRDTNGVLRTDPYVNLEKGVSFIILIMEILLWSNYLNIRKKLPFMNRNRYLDWVLTIIYSVLFVFLMLLALAIIESIG